MCWNSVVAGAARNAIIGEQLAVVRHHGSTNWIVNPANLEEPVCILDDTRVAVSVWRKFFGIGPSRWIREEAIFHQEIAGVPGSDFFCFIHGDRIIRLNDLEGRSAKKAPKIEVIWVPAAKPAAVSAHDWWHDLVAHAGRDRELVGVGANEN